MFSSATLELHNLLLIVSTQLESHLAFKEIWKLHYQTQICIMIWKTVSTNSIVQSSILQS